MMDSCLKERFRVSGKAWARKAENPCFKAGDSQNMSPRLPHLPVIQVHGCDSISLMLEKAMAPHSSTLAWKIPWAEEPGRLQSMGSPRVGPTERLHFRFHVLEKEMATHSSVLAWRIPGTGEPGGLLSMGSQSRTRLKRLSSNAILPSALFLSHIYCVLEKTHCEKVSHFISGCSKV